MPPIRTFTAPVKPMKTERTHEENQERAYIAASRRSDRSLEARVESARRASEIHKRRTGRALRVTEQDVVNEEMYEEEDEDLPMQYRRLAAHLNAGSSGLNKRLADYLTNHIAMRSALGQAISNANQQFPNPTNFDSIRNSPWANSSQQTTGTGANIPSPSTPRSPSSYRHTPYPTTSAPLPNQPIEIGTQGRSLPDQGGLAGSQQPPSKVKTERRASEPSLAGQTGGLSGEEPSEKSHSASPDFRPTNSQAGSQQSPPSILTEADGSHLTTKINPQYPPTPTAVGQAHLYCQHSWTNAPPGSLGPLTTSMPRETLMYPGYGFDSTAPFGNQASANNDKLQQSSYGTDRNAVDTSSYMHPFFHHGMDQTLAPSLVNSQSTPYNLLDESMGASDSVTPFTSGFEQSFAQDFTNMSDSGGGSGQLTPSGEHGWASFIDQSSWD